MVQHGGVYVVTGGGGFVGLRLALALAAGRTNAHGGLAEEDGGGACAPSTSARRPRGSARRGGGASAGTTTSSDGPAGIARGLPPAAEVRLFDVNPPPAAVLAALPPAVRFVAGDLQDAAAVADVIRGADVVFHIASYGMSGHELRRPELIRAVNVGGTAAVIAACVSGRCPRLVYVSTVNVVWAGRIIHGGDEDLPYPPPSAYKDDYSRTKAEAERLVLAANGTPLAPPLAAAASLPWQTAAAALAGGRGGRQGREEDEEEATGRGRSAGRSAGRGAAAASSRSRSRGRRGSGASTSQGPGAAITSGRQQSPAASGRSPGRRRPGGAARPQGPAGTTLLTCVIRPAGIYGPGEQRHQPRIIRMVRAGALLATFGPRDSLVDWLHVENLVQALVLAAVALGAGEGGGGGGPTLAVVAAAPAAGRVYFVTDGAPLNNFAFLRPLIEGLGYHFPSLNVPYWPVYAFAGLLDATWPLLRALPGYTPPLSRMEVDKACLTHYFSIDRARAELGYAPRRYTMDAAVRAMAAAGFAAPPRRGGDWQLLLFLAAALAGLALAALTAAALRRLPL